ncbi:MAG: hypothetical protein LBO82_08875, partial [Synergistaceae bacterium]|nr:hypothetical protein [Synergistaceae bacterium]
MLKFMMFSRKSVRKVGPGLLALLLLLAAAPRAWGGFEVTGGAVSGTHYSFSDGDNVLTINAKGLPANTVVSGEGKSIVVNGNDAKLTLQNLEVKAESGPAFKLNGASVNIRIAGTVTLNGWGGEGFLVALPSQSASNAVVILDAVLEDSILEASGGNGDYSGLRCEEGDWRVNFLILQGDGKFDFTGSGTGNGLQLGQLQGGVFMRGSAALSAAGGLTDTSRSAALTVGDGSLLLFENA